MRMKMLRLLGCAVTVLFFAGCATYPQHLTVEGPGENRVGPRDTTTRIYLLPPGDTREESMAGPFSSTKNKRVLLATGAVWHRVFAGDKDSPATLEIESSDLVNSISGAGFAARYTYEARAVLRFNGKDYHLSGTGSRAAAVATQSALRQSVELALVEISQKAQAILDASRP